MPRLLWDIKHCTPYHIGQLDVGWENYYNSILEGNTLSRGWGTVGKEFPQQALPLS